MKEKVLMLLAGEKGFVSGQELCEKLNVSRTAVWKAVHQLQEEGYEIEAVRNRGYRLLSIPDALSAEAIEATARTRWAGRRVVFFSVIDSSNDEAKKLAEQGAGHGTLVIAEQQTAGKGRRGRGFDSPAGTGIYMSLIIKDEIEPANASMLTLLTGLAIAEAISNVTGLKPQIKWPNDVILSGKKVCGILTEMSLQMDCINHIVIGAGINVQNESFPEEIAPVATSLFIESGKKTNRVELTAEILRRFESAYERFMRTQDLTYIMDDYNALLINRDRRVRVLDPKKPFEGTALQIDARGDLLVMTDGEIRPVAAGEVSVRGVYGYV